MDWMWGKTKLKITHRFITWDNRWMLVLFTEVGKCWEGIGFKAIGEETKDFVSDIFHLESLLTSKGKYGKTARHTDLELLEKVWVEIKIWKCLTSWDWMRSPGSWTRIGKRRWSRTAPCSFKMITVEWRRSSQWRRLRQRCQWKKFARMVSQIPMKKFIFRRKEGISMLDDAERSGKMRPEAWPLDMARWRWLATLTRAVLSKWWKHKHTGSWESEEKAYWWHFEQLALEGRERGSGAGWRWGVKAIQSCFPVTASLCTDGNYPVENRKLVVWKKEEQIVGLSRRMGSGVWWRDWSWD